MGVPQTPTTAIADHLPVAQATTWMAARRRGRVNLRSRRLFASSALMLVGMLGCFGCGESASENAHVQRLGAHERRISQGDYEDTWPFGPNEGVLRCGRPRSQRVVTFEVEDVRYALNSAARERGFANVRSILLTDHAGLPYDYSSLLRMGLELCRA
jgi:hypothetical protein